MDRARELGRRDKLGKGKGKEEGQGQGKKETAAREEEARQRRTALLQGKGQAQQRPGRRSDRLCNGGVHTRAGRVLGDKSRENAIHAERVRVFREFVVE